MTPLHWKPVHRITPGDVVRKPISWQYEDRWFKLFVWIGAFRLRVRFGMPQFEVRRITNRMLAESRAFMGEA